MRPLAPSKLAHFVYVFEATDQPQQVTTELNQLFDCQFDNTLLAIAHQRLPQRLVAYQPDECKQDDRTGEQ